MTSRRSSLIAALPRRGAVGAIRFYQHTFSRMFPPSCRFVPSCSHYAAEALDTHGLLRGGWMAVRRLLKCHPFHPGGFDPVRGRSPSAAPRETHGS